MEDVFKFLIVAGTIAFGIFKQVNKEKARKPENQMPLPEPEFDMNRRNRSCSKCRKLNRLLPSQLP